MAHLNKNIKKFKSKENISLKQFYEKRNKILIYRAAGGVGDILMHRMIFEDIKQIMPDAHVTFACPQKYHSIVSDHPFVDSLIDHHEINEDDYFVIYNTTSACTRHEMRVSPYSDKNRSDIWANHCGFNLKSHNMHINLNESQISFGIETLEKLRKTKDPTVIFCPISAMKVKNLTKEQMDWVVNKVYEYTPNIFGLHSENISELNVDTIHSIKLNEWAGVINACDYVVSVDTGAFHLAGGLSKPTVGIFTFADGKVYGKWYEKFILVQKHRDNGDWDCGPCYNWSDCPKSKKNPKPCLLEISKNMIETGIEEMFERF
jgi:ADP-heptose:LPS heptosyltransferase